MAGKSAVGAGTLKVWSVEILKQGLEAGDTETYRGYTATSGLRHQNESSGRRKKDCESEISLCERRKLKMCSPTHANHPWSFVCTCICLHTQTTGRLGSHAVCTGAMRKVGGTVSPSIVGNPQIPKQYVLGLCPSKGCWFCSSPYCVLTLLGTTPV